VGFCLKMVEEDNMKGVESNTDDYTLKSMESTQEYKKDEEKVSKDIDFDAMEFQEWLEYLRINEPKSFYGLLLAFTATTIFCIWLMLKIIGPAFPPKEPPCHR